METEPEVETLSEEPDQPIFHRGEAEDPTFSEWMEDQDFSLRGDFLWDLEGGLSRNWRKRLEQDDYEIGWPEGTIRSVRLQDGLRLWMAIHPSGTEVLTKYSRSDLAALGALTGYQVGDGEADISKIRWALDWVVRNVEYGVAFDPPWQKVLQGNILISTTTRETGENSQHWGLATLDYAEEKLLQLAFALARYYRPEFDGWPDKQQCEFLMAACERVNNVAKPINQLARFLEVGTGARGEKLRLPIEDAERDVKVAEWHDIDGLPYQDIGLMLSVKPTKSDEIKREQQRVRKMAERGRKLLNEALDGDWEAYASRVRHRRHQATNEE
jgi:hypothetical protein